MIGDVNSREARTALGDMTMLPTHGELILAFDPTRFAGGRGDPLARAETLLEAIAGQGARLPSQRRFAARHKAMAEGIALTGEEWAMLTRLLEG